MAITLLADGVTVNLNPDLVWSDEWDYTPVQESVDPSVTGALIIQTGVLQKGRPFTLQPEGDDSGWMKLSDVQQLRAWAAVPGKQFVLTIRGLSYTVKFRHTDKGFEARPVKHMRDLDPDDYYLCTIRLMEI